MRIHQLTVADALASLRSSPQGLSKVDAAARLSEYSPNRIERLAGSHWSSRLFREFTTLFSLILWVAAGLAFLADWYAPDEGMARVGLVVVLVILVSGLFAFWQEARVERTLKALENLLPQDVEVVREGALQTVRAESLVPGDVIQLRQGDKVPADCRVIASFGIRINCSTVTGESRPRSCDAEPSLADELADSRNVLLAGTFVVAGQGQAVVFATGARTAFGQIAHLTQSAGGEESPLRREIGHLSRVIAVIAVGIGGLFFIVGSLLGVPLWRDVLLSLGIIIAMVPEGLLPTLTLSLVLVAQRLARCHVLIRHLPSVETLGSVTVICTDKTGTLTENRMQVSQLFLDLEAVSVDRLANDLANTATTGLAPGAAKSPEAGERYRPFFAVARYCHSLTETHDGPERKFDGDPLEIALVAMSERVGALPPPPEKRDEWPFDSDRMRHSVVFGDASGEVLYCKGALESVLPLCERIVLSSGERVLDKRVREQILAAQARMAVQGLRVIALASRWLPAGCPRDEQERALTFCGLAGISDPPREDVDRAIAACRTAGIQVIMVTGDHPDTATAIARQIGLVRGDDVRVITGQRLQKLSATQLQIALDAPEIIFARVAADQKMRIVEALKQKGHVVAVTGDGVNDAPALRAAHIGIGMGRSGTDVAKEAADMVLLDDHFASIVRAVEEGRAVFGNIRKFLTYVLVHNVAELIPTLAFAVFRIPLPLTPVQALAIDMGTDSVTALGLGIEQSEADTMHRPPRARAERLLNWPLAIRAYLFLGLIEAAAALAVFFEVLLRGGWHYGLILPGTDALYREATTACLATIVLLQVVNVFLCRSAERSVFSTGFGGNRMILLGALWEVCLLLLISYTPWGNRFFGTAPLGMADWLLILPWGLAMLVLEELRKYLLRRFFAD